MQNHGDYTKVSLCKHDLQPFYRIPPLDQFAHYNKLSVGYFDLKRHRYILVTPENYITSCKKVHNMSPLTLKLFFTHLNYSSVIRSTRNASGTFTNSHCLFTSSCLNINILSSGWSSKEKCRLVLAHGLAVWDLVCLK